MKNLLEKTHNLFKDSIFVSFRFEEIWNESKINNFKKENLLKLIDKTKYLLIDLENKLKEIEREINETK